MQRAAGDWYGPEMATFGDRIAGAREAANMTRSALARRLGVRKDTLASWEEDRADPRANKLSMMAGVLNVSIMWLLNGEGDGMDVPLATVPTPAELKDVLGELRDLRHDLTAAEEKAALLEARLVQLTGGIDV